MLKKNIFKKLNFKKMVGAALLLCVTMGAVGCAKASDNKVQAQTKKLVVGTCADYPPYEFHKSINGKDEIVGFDIEIAKAIAKDMGMELEIKDMKFEGLLPALTTGKVDMILAGMTPTEERKQSVDFSKLYYTSKQGVIIRKSDAAKLNSIEALKNSAAGVQKSSIQEKLVKENLGAVNVKGLGKISDLVLELKNSKVDYVVMEAPVAESYVRNNPDLMLAQVNVSLEDGEGSAIAVKKGNPEMLNKINNTIDKLIQNGTITEFVKSANEMVEN